MNRFWSINRPSTIRRHTALVVIGLFIGQMKYILVPRTVLSLAPASTPQVYTGSHFSAISRGSIQGKHIRTHCAGLLVSLKGTTCLVTKNSGQPC